MSTPEHLPEPGPPLVERRRTPGPPPMAHGWRILYAALLLGILVAIALVGLGFYANQKAGDASKSDATLGALAADVAAKCKANPVQARKILGQACGDAQQINDRPPGAKGDRGPQGLRGPQGATGATGPRGETGAIGPVGPRGPAGPTGVAGKTPACLFLINACQGATGPAGADGAKGATGDQGATGAKGEKGDKGEPGATGAKGDPGEKGATGDQGPQGLPGKDCPEGSTLQKQKIVTEEFPTGVWTQQCVLDDQNP